jgi:L-ascorbate metabolism protein UlaG (beta-lactamase superfamily)
MDIFWLGHSCFRIKGNSATLITDPYSPETGYTMGKQTARIVTVSHSHPGHSYVQAVGDEPKAVLGPGEYEISGVLIVGFKTYHDTEKGEKRGKNTVYIIHMDELSICHLGDLGHSLTSDQLEELEDVDVLFIPVGGVSTIDGAKAAEVVRQIEPKIVIPMHYQTEALKRQLNPVDLFLKEIGAKDIEVQPKLTVNKSNLPQSMQVSLLSYESK